MNGFKCGYCGSNKLNEVQYGKRVSEVVGITVDDHIQASGFKFVKGQDTMYVCGECNYVATTKENVIVKQLKGGV